MKEVIAFCLGLSTISNFAAADDRTSGSLSPLMSVVDVDIDEAANVKLSDGSIANVKLLDVTEYRDSIRRAIRRSEVTVEVNGRITKLVAGNYELPKTFNGIQIDCAITKGYLRDSRQDSWALRKAARLRLWPAGSAWIRSGTFHYPVKQRWFAANTQMSNEPTWISGGEDPNRERIYYHSGLDIGGAEGMVEVVSATNGLVISAGTETIDPDRVRVPFGTKYDYVGVLDERGWFIRYIHLKEIDSQIKPGRVISMGDRIGVIGKEGASGGWSHLHFEIKAKQPSGDWGTVEGYAFLWQSYLEQHGPNVIACARPHRFAAVGQTVLLDASRTWSQSGEIAGTTWLLREGAVQDAQVERIYRQPGTYSEVLKVTDAGGAVSYDFASVQILDPGNLHRRPPTIHAAYAPTFGIKPGDVLTFKCRTFVTTGGRAEVWDFGDGSPAVKTNSDGNVKMRAENGYATTTHRYARAGDYIVKVTTSNHHGLEATTHLHVQVDAEGSTR